MYTVCKEIEFDACHRLTKNKGLCKNLHGHRYRVQAEVGFRTLDAEDMVTDFGELKRSLKAILDPWDHAAILNVEDSPVIKLCQKMGFRCVTMPADPTAEAMARHIYDALDGLIPRGDLMRVTVWETPTSPATYAPSKEYL